MMENRKIYSLLFDLFSILFCYASLVGSIAYFADIPLSLKAPLSAMKVYPFLEWPDWMIYSFLGVFFALVILLAFNPFRREEGVYGTARFANGANIKEMGLRALQGIVLGIHAGNFLITEDPLSVLVYAPPGTGKTAAIIIPTLFISPNSVLVYDPKGELYEKTGPYRSYFSNVVKFAPGEDESASWNPFAKDELPARWEDVEVLIERVASILYPTSGDSGKDHWPRQARKVFRFWAMYLVHRDGETTFPHIIESSVTEDPKGSIQECLFEEDLPQRIIIEGNALVGKEDKEFGSIFSTYDDGLSVFLDARVAKNVSSSEIKLNRIRKERTSIYICVSNADQKRLKDFLSLFFELAALQFISREKEVTDLNVTLLLDECRRLGKLQEVLTLPAISRSYGVNTIFVFQSTSQVLDIYGQGGLGELKNCCSYHVFFTQNEQAVAEDISKTVGPKTRTKRSKSGRTLESKSKSESEEGVPLILPQDVQSLPFGKLFVLCQGHFKRPIKAQAAFWWKNHIMAQAVSVPWCEKPQEVFSPELALSTPEPPEMNVLEPEEDLTQLTLEDSLDDSEEAEGMTFGELDTSGFQPDEDEEIQFGPEG